MGCNVYKPTSYLLIVAFLVLVHLMASRWKPVGSIIPSGTQRSANNSAFVQPLQSVPTGVTQLFPARLVVPPFGWSGPWHPLFKSGLFSQPGLINVEIAPKNYRAIP
eukprot:EG_transcript_62230